MDRRSFLMTALFMPAGLSPAFAQITSWPATALHLVVPYAAGGPTDVAVRLLADALSSKFPQRVIVENVTGAGTVVGTTRVATAKDGHTFLVATVAHAVNPVLFANLAFDPLKDLRGVALLGIVPQVVLVNKDVQASTLPELLELARKRPGGLTYGSAGIGSAQHLAAELLKSVAKIDLQHVPYRGSGPAVTDLIGGTLDIVIDSAATAIQQVKSGSVRALAVTTLQRLAALPDVPTVAETLPGYEAYTWNAVLAPAGAPSTSIAILNSAINATLAEPGLATRLSELGMTVSRNSTPESTDKFVGEEITKWQTLLRATGAKPN
ncbi:Bug family tripartite tricarboxylate transporter substrate binding protein [Bradyrhizobium roseum]|uniref:Bug family tripartite tricarboxylate transporter substrate binding protein n=1 Tax=Bradyrhizobium roseum TaxID=3056648 RepID=UPI0026220079|nr:tripartite tricarboxylate transporter substrate binding protein [Bradyrhizobium roseus]WKA25692.1 tripartite tricarboxylate transporter substrate binding protein [Bradyrhizobium roseus]